MNCTVAGGQTTSLELFLVRRKKPMPALENCCTQIVCDGMQGPAIGMLPCTSHGEISLVHWPCLLRFSFAASLLIDNL